MTSKRKMTKPNPLNEQLRSIAEGARDPSIKKVLESAFIAEVLQSITAGEPIYESEINAIFEGSFRHTENARKRFTVTPEGRTRKEVRKAAKEQWKRRKGLLDSFFEMKRGKSVMSNGKLRRVWIPVRALY